MKKKTNALYVGKLAGTALYIHWTFLILVFVIFYSSYSSEGNWQAGVLTDQPLPDAQGVIHNEWMVHELQTTCDFAPRNAILGWYIGGLNYQIEHHLFPNICHIHYKSIAPIVQQTARQFGFRYHVVPAFSTALTSHFRTLRELGKRPAAHMSPPAVPLAA